MKRIGEIIKIRPGCLEKYIAYHKRPWPEVDKMIYQCGIRNYRIYHYGEYLFASYDYVGDDYEGDMAKMAADPKTIEWWGLVKPLQEPLEGRRSDEWWKSMTEVYHLEEEKWR